MRKRGQKALPAIGYQFHAIHFRRRCDQEKMYRLIREMRVRMPGLRICRNTVYGEVRVGEFIHTLRKKLAQGRMSEEEARRWKELAVL